ncbi:MAG: imidazole glycerol phosphate synthase subunit HisH [Lentisphaerae bacterium]|nr:MAG: imidazole glycerol phosphate synthase subunit HisH [Lentisphaerota bacterium]
MICLLDYEAGNLTSVRLAFEALGIRDIHISREPDDVHRAERIVFPGVGAAAAAMDTLKRLELTTAIRAAVARGIPFLGICLGTQILLEFSEEDGGTPCLGIIPGQVKRFTPTNPYDKIPHMGWNAVEFTSPHPIFKGIESGSEFYFVHSYYPAPDYPENVLATTSYADVTFASVIGKANLVATQFHPERSGRIGLQLLKNFIEWNGSC